MQESDPTQHQAQWCAVLLKIWLEAAPHPILCSHWHLRQFVLSLHWQDLKPPFGFSLSSGGEPPQLPESSLDHT